MAFFNIKKIARKPPTRLLEPLRWMPLLQSVGHRAQPRTRTHTHTHTRDTRVLTLFNILKDAIKSIVFTVTYGERERRGDREDAVPRCG
jgi:hypothetical protein